MATNGLLINYLYCSGCRSCEVACKGRFGHEIPLGKWGIKVVEEGPWKVDDDNWEWNNIPVPTQLCDLCEERVAEGRKPACVHNCLADCMEYGPIEDLAKSAAKLGSKTVIFIP